MKLTPTVTKIVSGVPTSGTGTYAYAVLDCGHATECKLIPQGYACAECGRVQLHMGKCPCGYRGGFKSWDVLKNEAGVVDARDPLNQITHVGERMRSHCERCASVEQAIEAVKAAQADGSFAYARADVNGADRLTGRTHVYKRAPEAPRGVLLLTTLDDSHAARAFAETLSALSPTEGRS